MNLVGKCLRAATAAPGSPRAVTMLVLEPTLACNARCGACYNLGQLNPSPRDAITIAEIEKVAAAVPNLALLLLSGGEPSLHPDLPGVIDLFERAARPVFVSLPTNGVDPVRVERCVADACLVTAATVVADLSIDGVGALHDRLRGVVGGFERLGETYERLARLRSKHANLRLSANTCLQSGNAIDWPTIAQWVSEHWPAVEGHSFSLVRRPGRENAEIDGAAFLETNGPSLRQALRGRSGYRLGPLGLANTIYWHRYFELALAYRRGLPRNWRCSAGRNSLYIDGLGFVHPCEMLPPIGRLRDATSLAEILEGEGARLAVAGIEARHCACDHGCWIQHSMLDPRNWGEMAFGAFQWMRGA